MEASHILTSIEYLNWITGCNKTYSRASHLKRHVQNSHALKRTPAENGDCSSDEEENTKRDAIQCTDCPKKVRQKNRKKCRILKNNFFPQFQSKWSLKKHQTVAHGKDAKRYPCSTCGTTFAKKSWLKHHVAQHTGEFPHRCSKCSKTFKYPKKLRAHMAVHNYKCETCEMKVFSPLR